MIDIKGTGCKEFYLFIVFQVSDKWRSILKIIMKGFSFLKTEMFLE